MALTETAIRALKPKAKAYKDSWREGGTDFAPDRRYDRLISLLFPEISDRLPMAPS